MTRIIDRLSERRSKSLGSQIGLGVKALLVALVLPAVCLAAEKPLNVGILSNAENAKSFDEAIAALNWPSEKYDEAGWDKLSGNLKKHDLLVGAVGGSAVFPKKDAPDAAEKVAILRKYMEAGGGVVLTGIANTDEVSWLPLLDEKLEVVVTKPAAPVKESFKGENFTDRKLSLELNPKVLWPTEPLAIGFKPANPKEWETGGNWGGLNTVLVKRFGKGFLALSTTRYPGESILGNAAKMQRLQHLGIQLHGTEFEFEDPYTRVKQKSIVQGTGTATISFRNVSGAPLEVSAIVRLKNDRQKREGRRLMKNIEANKFVKLPLDVIADIRGETKVELGFIDPKDGSEVLVKETTVNLPQYMSVVPPAYRGMISTARRDKDVHFKLRFAPIYARHEEVKVALKLSDSNGQKISEKEMVVSNLNVPVKMDLPADAPEGKYKISAVAILNDGSKEVAEGEFKIVPVRPGQVFVDQDTVLLKDGKPFFPIGIYHVTDEQINDVAEVGFNLIQLWARYATPEAMENLQSKGIQALWEEYAWGALVRLSRTRTIDEEYALNHKLLLDRLQIQRDAAAKLKNHPALSMWYVGDEPPPSQVPGLRKIHQTWHEVDEDHPTYLVATGNYDKFQDACDILGIDVYPVYRGVRHPLTIIADATDNANQGVDYRKPIIAIPQSFGFNEQHHEKPEDVRAMSYLFLTHGVRGIIWYCWKETGDITGVEGAGNHPATIKILKELVAETKEIAPALMEPGARILKTDDGKIHAIICGSAATGRYFVYVNAVETPVKGKFDLPELQGKKLESLFGTPKGSVKKGVLELDLPALATGIYKIQD